MQRTFLVLGSESSLFIHLSILITARKGQLCALTEWPRWSFRELQWPARDSEQSHWICGSSLLFSKRVPFPDPGATILLNCSHLPCGSVSAWPDRVIGTQNTGVDQSFKVSFVFRNGYIFSGVWNPKSQVDYSHTNWKEAEITAKRVLTVSLADPWTFSLPQFLPLQLSQL